jgi:molybdopterin synthase catalytic subunit
MIPVAAQFRLSAEPIHPGELTRALAGGGAGALVTFEGIVRAEHHGREVVLLEYEAHDEVAQREFEKIAVDARRRHPVLRIHCVHRTGSLKPGEIAVWMGATALHRHAAFGAIQFAMNALKKRLPIWKKEHYADGTSGWINPPDGAGGMAEDNLVRISRDEINALPMRSYEGPIHLVDADELVAPACEALAGEKLLGFDTETRPSFKPGVSYPSALVQLAGEKAAYIFQLHKLTQLDPLFALFSRATPQKAGIALADDLKKLQHLRAFKPAGFIELGNLARELSIANTGLRPLAAKFLGFRVSKREQRSNWARQELTRSQIVYAATDAWVSRELCIALTTQVAEKK